MQNDNVDAKKTELLPCPWCGEEAEKNKNVFGTRLNPIESWTVYHECKVLGMMITTGWRDSEQEAYSVWNTRSDATIQRLQERIKEMEAEKPIECAECKFLFTCEKNVCFDSFDIETAKAVYEHKRITSCSYGKRKDG